MARFYTPSGRCIQKPYAGADYEYDIYKRWIEGEMFVKDSIKIDSTEAYRTVSGRIVYGGGGIIPDIFVPVDTTKATNFYIKCNKKATQMRYASMIFDKHKNKLSEISDYEALDVFLDGLDIPSGFLAFALSKDGIRAADGEWAKSEPYLMPQLRALVARYSKLGDNAFYKLYQPVDDVVKAALSAENTVAL